MANESLAKSRKGIGGGDRAPSIRMKCLRCGAEYMASALVQVFCGIPCRFAAYQNKGEADQCWEWRGPLSADGYGVLSLGGPKNSRTTAHRYSFVDSGGELTAEKPCVLHRCDNPRCTNPAHLFVGDWKDNNRDRSRKGRNGYRSFSEEQLSAYSTMNRGEKNNWAKLTEDVARKIKRGHPELSNKQAADLYGVSKAAVSHIRTGRNWRHI